MKRLLLVSILLSAPLFASGATFTTGDAIATGIGGPAGNQYDKLILDGYAGVFSPSPAEIDIGLLTFVVNPDLHNIQSTPITGALPFNFTINGITQVASIAYSWTSPSPGNIDFITFTPPSDLVFANYLVDFSNIHNLNGARESENDITAKFKAKITAVNTIAPKPVDEASSLFMITFGMFMIAYGTTNTSRVYAVK